MQIGWLNAIREWQEEFVGNMSSREFVDTITRDLLGSRVFVFTPKGEVREDYFVCYVYITIYLFLPFSEKTIRRLLQNIGLSFLTVIVL